MRSNKENTLKNEIDEGYIMNTYRKYCPIVFVARVKKAEKGRLLYLKQNMEKKTNA